MTKVNLVKHTEPPGHALCLTPTEAAKQLHISRTKMYALLRQKAIPHVRLGRKILIPTKELAEWLHEQTSPANAKTKGGETND